MGTAQQQGGLYYVNGVAMNAKGEELHGAPPAPALTVPAPAAVGSGKTLAQEIAEGVAAALQSAPAPASKPIGQEIGEAIAAALPSAIAAMQPAPKADGDDKAKDKK